MDSLEFHPSRSAQRRAGGQHARPLSGSGASGRRRAGTEGGRYPGAPRTEPGRRADMRRLSEKASILPGLGRSLGLRHYYVDRLPTDRSRQEAEARLRPQGLPGRAAPGAARGRGSPGRRPRIPTPPRQPIRVVTGHGLRPPRL